MSKKENKVIRRGIALYIDGQEVKNDLRTLQAELKRAKEEIKGMTVGSREYLEQLQKIKDLNTIIKEHKAKLREVNEETKKFSLSKGVDVFNKYAASATALIAALTGVVLKLNSFRKMLHEREDAKANVQALTGLDDDSINWLEQQAVRLSTSMESSGLRIRKSASEILEAYMLVGSNKPELLADKEALNAVTVEAMRLAEASKMDLKSAVNAVTTALNQYGAGADDAAQYVNVLAAGSKVGASAVDAQAAAILKAGTIAASSNIPIEQLVGSIEMLGEKGIKNEIAGTGLKTFFTRLATGATDTNPKVVGLYTALDNLNSKVREAEKQQVGGGTTLLKKLFGDEGMQTAMILTQNADKVRYYAEAVTDTNIAIEQAAINSDTAAAKLAQVKNELNEQGILLMKELNPAITATLNKFVNLTRYSVPLVKGIADHRATLGLLTVAIVTYNGWVNRQIILSKLQVFWNQKVTTSFKALTLAIKANPWALIISAATVAIGVLIDYRREQDKVTAKMKAEANIRKKAEEQYESEADRIKTLREQIENNNLSLEHRRRKLEELKSIVPGYLAELTDEGTLINNNKEALNDYLKNLEKEIRLKAVREELEELYRNKRKAENRLPGEEAEFTSSRNAYYGALFSASQSAQGLGTSGSRNLSKGLDQATLSMKSKMDRAAEAVRNTKQEIVDLDAAIAALNEEINEGGLIEDDNNGGGKCPVCGQNPCICQKNIDNSDKKNEALLALEEKYQQKRQQIKEKYLSGEISSREDFELLMQDLELQALEEKLRVLDLEPAKRAEIQQKILDAKIKFMEEEQKMDQQNEEAALQRQKDANDAKLAAEKEAAEERQQYLEKTADTIESIASDFGQTIGDMIANGEASMKEFVKETVLMALDALKKILLIKYLEIEAKEIAATTPFSFIGAAKAAARVAALEASFALVKGLVSNFWTGGFTGPGAWNEPQGIVHSDEFVANRYAVANPAVRPFLDLLDNAQKRGTVANLSAEDIAAVVPASRQRTGTAVQVVSPGTDRNNTDPMLLATMGELRSVVAALGMRLKRPIKANVVLTGPDGFKEKWDELNQLLDNKTVG